MPTLRETPDHEKNDFQNAVKRNLHTWAEWRTMINDRLVEAVISGKNIPEDVETFDRYMSRSVRKPNHPTTNPKTLLTYSAAPNSATSLRRGCFYKYGIPRVKLDPYSGSNPREERFGSTSSMSSSASNDRNSHSSQSSLSDDDLALDYFYYEKPTNKKEDKLNDRRSSNTVSGVIYSGGMNMERREGGVGNRSSSSNGRATRGGGNHYGGAAVTNSNGRREFNYGITDQSSNPRRNELTRYT